MKSILISIQPKWCELIASGKKTVEVRKTRPKLETPFKVYIYCTNTRPYLVWGDVFRGNWETEFTHLSGYNRREAERIWDVFNGKVIGEFVCDEILGFNYGIQEPDDATSWQDCYKGYPEALYDLEGTCLTVKGINDYGNGRFLYTWHISDLVIYDKPRELSEFSRFGITEHCGWGECDLCRYGKFINNDWKCTNQITRPPQSWCYIEEVHNG